MNQLLIKVSEQIQSMLFLFKLTVYCFQFLLTDKSLQRDPSQL